MNTPQQIPLRLSPADNASFARFYTGQNHQVINDLKQMIYSENFIYLWGAEHTGKSHLLQATCVEANQKDIAAIYIPLSQYQEMSVDLLDNLAHLSLVCLDDVHCIAGNIIWEAAIFNLFNQLRSQKKSLLVASNQSSMQLSLNLADLKSRLSWGTQYQLHRLSEQEKSELIEQEAKHRGMILSADSIAYLMRHYSRNLADLVDFIARLDKDSLSAKRKPSIPFIKGLLKS